MPAPVTFPPTSLWDVGTLLLNVNSTGVCVCVCVFDLNSCSSRDAQRRSERDWLAWQTQPPSGPAPPGTLGSPLNPQCFPGRPLPGGATASAGAKPAAEWQHRGGGPAQLGERRDKEEFGKGSSGSRSKASRLGPTSPQGTLLLRSEAHSPARRPNIKANERRGRSRGTDGATNPRPKRKY